MRINYPLAIEALLQLKSRLRLLELSSKHESIIHYLERASIDWEAVDLETPGIKEISEATGLKRQKVNDAIYELYRELLTHVATHPVEINRVVHLISIHIPMEDEHEYVNKQYLEAEKERSMYMEVFLPVTPRVGDLIDLSFVDRNVRFNHGYVHEVQHIISPIEQRIYLMVHPYKKVWAKWIKMVQEEERRVRYR